MANVKKKMAMVPKKKKNNNMVTMTQLPMSKMGQKNYITQKEKNVYRSPQNGEVVAAPNYQFIRMLQ